MNDDKYIRVETPEHCPFCSYNEGCFDAVKEKCAIGNDCTGYYKNCFDGDCPFLKGNVIVSPKHKQSDRKHGVSIVFGVEQPIDTTRVTKEVKPVSNRAKLLGDTPITGRKGGF